MQGEFEKQVQNKLKELTVHPSAPVWQNIKREITPQRNRKRMLLWFFLVVLTTAGALYLWRHSLPGTNATANRETPLRQQPRTAISPAINSQAPSISAQDKPIRSPRVFNTPKNRIAAAQNFSVEKRTEAPSAQTSESAGFKAPLTQNEINTTRNRLEAKSIAESSEPRQNHVAVTRDLNENFEDHAVRNQNTRQETLLKDSLAPLTKDSLADSQSKPLAPHNPDSLATPNRQPKAHKFVAAVHGNIGHSRLASGLGLFEKSYADYLASPGSSSGTPPGNALPPAQEKAGTSLSAGVSIKKMLNRHFSLSVGLDYNFYSTRITTGERVWKDTVITSGYRTIPVQSYYQNTNATGHRYTNQFHFLSLPLTLQFAVSDKLPLVIAAGISLQQLISGNALIYHSTGQFYYRDKEALKKTQVFSELTVSYDLKRFSVGPSLQYGLTRTLRQGNSNNHMFTAGLKAGFILNK